MKAQAALITTAILGVVLLVAQLVTGTVMSDTQTEMWSTAIEGVVYLALALGAGKLIKDRVYSEDTVEDMAPMPNPDDPQETELIAASAHEVWMAGKIRDGWTWAPVTNKTAKRHSSLVPYEELEEGDKESDRDFARAVPRILAGYRERRLGGGDRPSG